MVSRHAGDVRGRRGEERQVDPRQLARSANLYKMKVKEGDQEIETFSTNRPEQALAMVVTPSAPERTF